MIVPRWLEEMHHQWLKRRGKSLAAFAKPFARNWEKLLADSGIVTATDIKAAILEAERLQNDGKITFDIYKGRKHQITTVYLPLQSEEWLRSLFGTHTPHEIRHQSLRKVDAAARHHPIYPQLWDEWLIKISTAFESGKNLGPLSWRRPNLVEYLIKTTFLLTSRRWAPETLIREVSAEINPLLPLSKDLEKSIRILESCLSLMFRQSVSFGMIGIRTNQLRLELAGQLSLHFPEGTIQKIDQLQGVYQLTSDLEQAIHASTIARRILTVENSKTTLRRLAALNTSRDTLLIGCSFPGPGLARLMRLLPPDIPIFHFGDTDPAGFLILSKLRQMLGPRVKSILMNYRRSILPVPLTEYDEAILPKLLDDPYLQENERNQILLIQREASKGTFEQESLGRPDLNDWPFYQNFEELQKDQK